MVVRRVVATFTQRQVRYVDPVAESTATGLVAQVYAQAADEMRIVIPPVLVHSPSPQVLAAYWMLMREPLMATGAADRLDKEVVAAAVSVATTCPYCVDMHSTGMYDLTDEADAEAIAADRLDEVTQPRLRELARWAREGHLPQAPLTVRPPFPAGERPELVGTLVAFHYLTRMVNVFLGNALIPAGLGPGTRQRFKRGVSRLLSPTLRAIYPPGRSVDLLPSASLPDDAAWAQGNAAVAAAVARSYHCFEAAGRRALAPVVRELIQDRLDRWQGEQPGLSRQWCEDLVSQVPSAQRASARLVALTALASSQVDAGDVAEFQRRHPDDRTLIDATAWGAFAAARRIGGWHAAV